MPTYLAQKEISSGFLSQCSGFSRVRQWENPKSRETLVVSLPFSSHAKYPNFSSSTVILQEVKTNNGREAEDIPTKLALLTKWGILALAKEHLITSLPDSSPGTQAVEPMCVVYTLHLNGQERKQHVPDKHGKTRNKL
jgi:hypothetical protein